MSDTNTIYSKNPNTKIIARNYLNPRFGKGIGNKRINRFIFNGSLVFPDIGLKLWVDLPEIEYSKTSCFITDHARLDRLARKYIQTQWKADPRDAERFLFGQLFTLQPKTFVDGFLLHDLDTANALVAVWDEESTTIEDMRYASILETFPITPVHKHCEGKARDYFGTNFDMQTNVSKPPQTDVIPTEFLNKVKASVSA